MTIEQLDRVGLLAPPNILDRHKVRTAIGYLLRNNPVQLLRLPAADYVNLGCGGNVLKGFVNIDYRWRRGVLCWDISKGVPLRSDSVSGVFTEHALEHFEWQFTLNTVLPEIRRILKPGGVVRISVPDAEMVIDEYLKARESGETSKVWDHPHHEEANRLHLTPMGRVNNAFRRIYEPYVQGHKFLYDFQTLEHFLHLTGFTDVTKTAYMEGRDPRMLVDYKRRASESLYVEATRS